MSTGTVVEKRKASSAARVGLLLLFIALVLAGLLATGWLPRVRKQAMVEAEATSGEDTPLVGVVTAKRSSTSVPLELPGNVEAAQMAPVYARTSGYLRKRLMNIGDMVTAGQVIAEIETPEADQDAQQARANLAQAEAALKQKRAAQSQAKANLGLAKVTMDRWDKLVAGGVIAKQAGDEKRSAYEVTVANVEAAEADIRAAEENIRSQQANVRRLDEVRGYQKVLAPFSGVVTSAPLDEGALITSGANAGGREINRIAMIDELRIYIPVPQTHVASIKVGQDVTVRVAELPGRSFPAKVLRTANALDPASRTLLTEVRVKNPKHELLPGMYATVGFSMVRQAVLLLPAAALLVRPDGTYAVAVVTTGSKVHYQKITTGKDMGMEMEVLTGLEGSEALIMNPADDLAEGMTVRVVAKAKAEAKPAH